MAPRHICARGLTAEGILKPQRLDGIVISVGNLTTGGTGKTPMVLVDRRAAAAEGKEVGILTRGYRGDKIAPASGNKSQAAATNAVVSTSDEVRMLQARLGDRVHSASARIATNRAGNSPSAA